jgi:hypothetical protein
LKLLIAFRRLHQLEIFIDNVSSSMIILKASALASLLMVCPDPPQTLSTLLLLASDQNGIGNVKPTWTP